MRWRRRSSAPARTWAWRRTEGGDDQRHHGQPASEAIDQYGYALRLDGLELAIGGSPDAGMQIWDLDPDHWIDAACCLAGRNLTREEWDTNIGILGEYRPTCDPSAAAD